MERAVSHTNQEYGSARSSSPADFAIDRRLPAADQVYQLLRNEILTCRLAPYQAISENRICGMFGVSRSPVRVAVTRLAEDGLIETATDANDRRIQRVRLTPRGQGVFNKMAKAHAACVDRLLGGLSQADKQALTRLLDGAKASIRRELEVEATP